MGGADFLGRWVDLAAHLLMQPSAHDPMIEICDELAERYSAAAAGTVDFSEVRARIGLYRCPFEPARYASGVGDHPLARHYRDTGDAQARCLDEVQQYAADPWSRAVLDHLRAQHLVDFVCVPLLPLDGMDHRWLGLASAGTLGMNARHELERLRPLIQAIDAQSRVLDEGGAGDPGHSAATDLTAREIAVLTLIARGLTAGAIAHRLRISARTVSKHQEHIYRKLEVQDRLRAVMRAQAVGILPGPDGPGDLPAARFIDVAVARHGAAPPAIAMRAAG